MAAKTESSRTNWIAVFLLWGIGLAAAMQFAKFSISLPNLAEHYSVESSIAALMLSSVGIMGIILGAAAGAVVGMIGTRRSLLAALAIGILSSAIQASLPPYEIMLLSRLFEGISHLLIVVAAPTAIISLSAPEHKSYTMGLWATFFGVAYAITGLIGAPIQEIYGISYLYGSHAGVLGLLMILYFAFSDRSRQSSNISLLQDVRTTWSRQLQVYGSLARSTPALAFFWHTLMFVALLTFLPSLATRDDDRHLLTTILPVITIVGSFVGGAIAQKTQRPIALMISAFTIFAGFAAVIHFTLESQSFIYSACLAMFVSGIIQASVFAAVPQLSHTEMSQAQANGAITQLGNLGATCGTPIFAAAISWFGNSAVPLLAVIFATMAVLMLLMISQKGLQKPRVDDA